MNQSLYTIRAWLKDIGATKAGSSALINGSEIEEYQLGTRRVAVIHNDNVVEVWQPVSDTQRIDDIITGMSDHLTESK